MNLKKEIIFYSKKLHEKGFVSATDGNISVKVKKRFIVTPTSFPKQELKEKDLVDLDKNGNPIKGNPSSEVKMHLKIYETREEIQAVVHAHPPFVTALSLIVEDFDVIPLSEFFITLKKVKVLPFLLPGSEKLSEEVREAVKDKNVTALVLKNHGAVTIGISLKSAFYKMEALEHAAKTFLFSNILGSPKPFPKKVIEKLIKIGENYGLK